MVIGTALPTDLDVDLAGLSAIAATWIAKLPVADQRVQSIPDGRTLRFYQSAGLLDRPSRYDGRVARYGRRHLLQLLAIRALQSTGHTLAQIQTSLAGASDAELTTILQGAFGNHIADTAAPQPAAPTAPPALVAAELAPGVVITIDSRLQTDPARVIARLRRAIQGEHV